MRTAYGSPMTARLAVAFNLRGEVFSMASTVRLLAVVDFEGRVVAAQLAEQATGPQDQDVPSVGDLIPLKGQRTISVDVPREVLELPGPDLHRFLTHLKIAWPADVQVPKIEIVKQTEVVKKKKR